MFFRIKLWNEGFFAEKEMCSGSPRAQSVEQETECHIFPASSFCKCFAIPGHGTNLTSQV